MRDDWGAQAQSGGAATQAQRSLWPERIAILAIVLLVVYAFAS